MALQWKLRVEGMTCEHCEVAVRRALEGVGARNVRADFRQGEAVLEADEPADPERWREAIRKAGYQPGELSLLGRAGTARSIPEGTMGLTTLSGQTLEGAWREDPTACPHCGRVSWPVPQNITLVAHIREAYWPSVKAQTDRFKGFRFCPHLGCPVVYFHRDADLVVVESEVRTRVGYKADTPPIPVCYCVGVLAETIRTEVVEKGCCDSLEDIQRYTGARTGKWCHITNPSGRCCGPMVQRVIEAALRERVEAGLADRARRLAEQVPSDGVGEAPDIVPDACCRLPGR